MKPIEIINTIEQECVCFKRSEIIALQRYWLAYFYPHYKEEAIAKMTGDCDRSYISTTIKRLKTDKYIPVHDRIVKAFIMKSGKPQYKWIGKEA